MRRINAGEKILREIRNMGKRGVKSFTCRELAAKASVSPHTIRKYIREDNGKTISLVKKGNSAAAATYRYKVPFCERIECFDAHVMAWIQCVKWANIAVDPELAGLGKFAPIGNTYHYR